MVVDNNFSYQFGCIGGGGRVRDGGADEAVWWLLLDDGRCRSRPSVRLNYECAVLKAARCKGMISTGRRIDISSRLRF